MTQNKCVCGALGELWNCSCGFKEDSDNFSMTQSKYEDLKARIYYLEAAHLRLQRGIINTFLVLIFVNATFLIKPILSILRG
jgi:hypothetical protein